MTHRPTHHSLLASAAIAAALALSSTTAFAQDAAPSMDTVPAPVIVDTAPVTPPAATTAPTTRIVLPDELTTPVAEQVAAPAPAPATTSVTNTSTPAAPRQRAAAPATPRMASGAPARSAPVANVPAQAPATSTDILNASGIAPSAEPASPSVQAPAAAAPAAAPISAEAAPVPADGSDNTLAIAAILAGLVGIGAAGTMAMRRRYRNSATAYEPAYERVGEPAPAMASRAAVAAPVVAQPEVSEPVVAAPVVAEPVAVREYAPADARDSGWAVAQSDIDLPGATRPAVDDLPAGPVPTGEARQRLLDRMVAAAPDEANPFTSKAARRKRARIILATREQHLRDDATRPFDFRTYRPSMKRADLPEPALV